MGTPANYRKGLPAIPEADLLRVSDPATRAVLRAITNGWNMRNGASGNGDSRFVTLDELKSVQGSVQQVGKQVNQLSSLFPGGEALTSGDIAGIITELQAQVLASQQFQDLGERITLIDTTLAAQGNSINQEVLDRSNGDNAILTYTNQQFSAVGSSIGALQSQQTTTANSVSALASTVSTVQAQVGTNTTAIQTEATARINADGTINSKYGVKIDSNGYVTGFGLISTANNATPFSQFLVRADRFAIASPSGPGITPAVPFIVNTTPTTLQDGTILPPGVYIDTAVVKRLTGAFIYAGTLQAGIIYTGSQYVDLSSKQPVAAAPRVSTFVKSYTPVATTPVPYVRTISYLTRFYGTGWHGHAFATPNNRIRKLAASEQMSFIVTVSATVDQYLSIWYRLRTDDPSNLYGPSDAGWQAPQNGEFCTEPQSDYGSASLTVAINVYVPDNAWIEFTAAPIGQVSGAWVPANTGKVDLRDFSILAQATNL